MDLINRYIAALTKGFPRQQRQDIEKELRANIEDMIEADKGAFSHEEKVIKVLEELGNPQILADEYRGNKKYLIGPKYFEVYFLILKIVILAVAGGITIAIFVSNIFTPEINITKVIIDFLSGIFTGTLQAFAWTTIIFIIIERKNADKIAENDWDISKLPPEANKKADIPMIATIITTIVIVIFSSIFIVFLFSAPEYLAAYIFDGKNISIIPIFNIEVVREYSFLIISVFILGIVKEILKLYYGRWNLKLAIKIILITIISTVISIIVITDNNLWNPSFAIEISEQLKISSEFIKAWLNIKYWLALVIIAASILEIGTSLYKGIRYNI